MIHQSHNLEPFSPIFFFVLIKRMKMPSATWWIISPRLCWEYWLALALWMWAIQDSSSSETYKQNVGCGLGAERIMLECGTLMKLGGWVQMYSLGQISLHFWWHLTIPSVYLQDKNTPETVMHRHNKDMTAVTSTTSKGLHWLMKKNWTCRELDTIHSAMHNLKV